LLEVPEEPDVPDVPLAPEEPLVPDDPEPPDVPEEPLDPDVPLPSPEIKSDRLVPDTYRLSTYTAFNGVFDEPRSTVIPGVTFSVSI
jgi:hypothetical protein